MTWIIWLSFHNDRKTMSLLQILVTAYIIKFISIFLCCMMVQQSKEYFHYFAYGSNLLKKRIHINNPSAVFLGIGRLDVSCTIIFLLWWWCEKYGTGHCGNTWGRRMSSVTSFGWNKDYDGWWTVTLSMILSSDMCCIRFTYSPINATVRCDDTWDDLCPTMDVFRLKLWWL